MWRLGIAAILSAVLIALVSNMVGSGSTAARAFQWLLSSSWYSALTGGADAGEVGPRSPATSGPQLANGWSDDVITPAHLPAREDAPVPVPAARPSEPWAPSPAGSVTSELHAYGSQEAADKSATRHTAEAQSRLAGLGHDPRRHAPLSREELGAVTPPLGSQTEERKRRDVFGSILGGFQRLLGRDFDSVHRPGELAAYCHANADTWIYDFGREAFLYCGNVIAGQFSDQAAVMSPQIPR